MIKFFRKIRQNLLLEGKIGKYLKYAIGEILLVVIGILIALQLNNVNENWKREELRQELFLELKSSIMSDTVILNYEKKYLISAFVNAKHLKKVIQDDLPYSKSFDSSFAKIEMVNTFEADYTILDRLLNIGIEIIDDKTLMNEIVHYYEDSKDAANRGNKAKALLSDKIYPNYFISYNYRLEAVPDDFNKLKNANAFKIALEYSLDASDFLIKRSIHRKNLATEILKMLDDKITIKKDKLDKNPYVRELHKKDSIDIAREMDKIMKMNVE
jgi:hypothetical protein